jgi:aerobic-type carbon monoxide dehydrogenase small subunit (CoxS/CutS family)
VTISFSLNGRLAEVDADGMRPLLSVLREDLGLRAAKPGCGEGRCGACTVLVNNRPVVACLYPVALASGKTIRTAEGLATEDALAPLQQALLDHGGLQCGACTPGIMMTLTALLERSPAPSPREVREALTGNLCRCTGYESIVAATLAVAGTTS